METLAWRFGNMSARMPAYMEVAFADAGGSLEFSRRAGV
jgi:hypothetical protein